MTAELSYTRRIQSLDCEKDKECCSLFLNTSSVTAFTPRFIEHIAFVSFPKNPDINDK